MAGKRILIIEDDPANLRLMMLLLNAAGHAATGAGSGEQGLAAARREPPDLILCDGCMPGLSGLDVIGQVRSDQALAGIPVVAVTGLARTGQAQELLDAGFTGYIAKPFAIKTFAAEVQRFLGDRPGSPDRVGGCPAPSAQMTPPQPAD